VPEPVKFHWTGLWKTHSGRKRHQKRSQTGSRIFSPEMAFSFIFPGAGELLKIGKVCPFFRTVLRDKPRFFER
jgi:hypothetical protein